MAIQNFSNKTQTQNQEVQVFIIKQFERSEKQKFEEKYANYINGKNIFLNDTSLNIINSLIYSGGRQNYLIPLIYDESQKDNIILEEMKINGDLYYYNKNGIGDTIYIDKGKQRYWKKKIDNFYYFKKYSFLLEYPLIDYTKLSYVYQIKNDKKLGIGNVISVDTQFSVNSSSNCIINFACGDNDEINKEMFDTNDIVIVKILKNQKDINKIKNSDDKNLYDDEFNMYKNIFTGYIDNVNYTIDWSNKSKTLNLVCSGPTKKMLFTRIISGQATANTTDWTSALVPLSVYSFPQTLDSNGNAELDNETIVKNIVIRTFCDLDVIPEVKENKLAAEYYFNQNAIAVSSKDSEFYQSLYEYKMKYDKAIRDNMYKYYENVYDNDGNKLYIKIKNNQVSLITGQNTQTTFRNIDGSIGHGTLNGKMQLPIMIINGTNQPSYQYSFNNLQNTFASQYETLFQFLQKIATTLDFCLYDDADGTIHFEVYDTSLMHLYDLNNANNLKNIITFSENQNTNEMSNIIQASNLGIFQGMQDTAEYGIFTLVRDQNSVKKLGERFLNLGTVTGLQNTVAKEEGAKLSGQEKINKIYMQPLTTYARCMMQKVNSKALSQISVRLLGNPLITMGKYAYIKDIGKLFYINSIRQSWQSNSFYTIDLSGIYTREKICGLDELTDNNYYDIDKKIKIQDMENGTTLQTTSDISNLIPNSRKNSIIAKFQYVKQYINNELQKAYDNNNVISRLEELFYQNKNLYFKLQNILKSKFNYDDEDFLRLIYDNKNYIFTYLDGYFWEIPMQSDAFNLALQQQEQIKSKIL